MFCVGVLKAYVLAGILNSLRAQAVLGELAVTSPARLARCVGVHALTVHSNSSYRSFPLLPE